MVPLPPLATPMIGIIVKSSSFKEILLDFPAARKTASETIRFSWQKNPELRKLLPAYPARVVRNRPHVDCMSLKYGVR